MSAGARASRAPLAQLDELEGYCRLFTSVELWAPYAREVFDRHGLLPAEPVRLGVPGTCPVFIAGERWVVKFFGRLFDGARSFEVERECARLTAAARQIPLARVSAWGELGGEGWPWPYLVFDYISGASIGEVMEAVRFEDWLSTARLMGRAARELHALPLAGQNVFPNDHDRYARFLEEQRAGCAGRHREWAALPENLIRQIDDFLPPLEGLVDRSRPPHLIHGDLTRDHLLGHFEGDRWVSDALIDFGDAMTGDLLYELVALHLDLFHSDKRLLAAFLEAYGASADFIRSLPRRAMATTLLHRFNVLSLCPALATPPGTLEALANQIWEVQP